MRQVQLYHAAACSRASAAVSVGITHTVSEVQLCIMQLSADGQVQSTSTYMYVHNLYTTQLSTCIPGGVRTTCNYCIRKYGSLT